MSWHNIISMPYSMEQENPPSISKRQLNKAKRKEGKAKSVLLKHENIKVSDVPTKVSSHSQGHTSGLPNTLDGP